MNIYQQLDNICINCDEVICTCFLYQKNDLNINLKCINGTKKIQFYNEIQKTIINKQVICRKCFNSVCKCYVNISSTTMVYSDLSKNTLSLVNYSNTKESINENVILIEKHYACITDNMQNTQITECPSEKT